MKTFGDYDEFIKKEQNKMETFSYYDKLREEGFTHCEAKEILDYKRKPIDSSTGLILEQINQFIGIPDIALIDYDPFEHDLLL